MHTSHYSRLEKPNIPIATQVRLPRIYYTQYLSLRIRTTGISQLEKKKQRKEKKIKERKEKRRKTKQDEKGKQREENDKKSEKRQDKKARKEEEKKREKK